MHTLEANYAQQSGDDLPQRLHHARLGRHLALHFLVDCLVPGGGGRLAELIALGRRAADGAIYNRDGGANSFSRLASLTAELSQRCRSSAPPACCARPGALRRAAASAPCPIEAQQRASRASRSGPPRRRATGDRRARLRPRRGRSSLGRFDHVVIAAPIERTDRLRQHDPARRRDARPRLHRLARDAGRGATSTWRNFQRRRQLARAAGVLRAASRAAHLVDGLHHGGPTSGVQPLGSHAAAGAGRSCQLGRRAARRSPSSVDAKTPMAWYHPARAGLEPDDGAAAQDCCRRAASAGREHHRQARREDRPRWTRPAAPAGRRADRGARRRARRRRPHFSSMPSMPNSGLLAVEQRRTRPGARRCHLALPASAPPPPPPPPPPSPSLPRRRCPSRAAPPRRGLLLVASARRRRGSPLTRGASEVRQEQALELSVDRRQPQPLGARREPWDARAASTPTHGRARTRISCGGGDAGARQRAAAAPPARQRRLVAIADDRGQLGRTGGAQRRRLRAFGAPPWRAAVRRPSSPAAPRGVSDELALAALGPLDGVDTSRVARRCASAASAATAAGAAVARSANRSRSLKLAAALLNRRARASRRGANSGSACITADARGAQGHGWRRRDSPERVGVRAQAPVPPLRRRPRRRRPAPPPPPPPPPPPARRRRGRRRRFRRRAAALSRRLGLRLGCQRFATLAAASRASTSAATAARRRQRHASIRVADSSVAAAAEEPAAAHRAARARSRSKLLRVRSMRHGVGGAHSPRRRAPAERRAGGDGSGAGAGEANGGTPRGGRRRGGDDRAATATAGGGAAASGPRCAPSPPPAAAPRRRASFSVARAWAAWVRPARRTRASSSVNPPVSSRPSP